MGLCNRFSMLTLYVMIAVGSRDNRAYTIKILSPRIEVRGERVSI